MYVSENDLNYLQSISILIFISVFYFHCQIPTAVRQHCGYIRSHCIRQYSLNVLEFFYV